MRPLYLLTQTLLALVPRRRSATRHTASAPSMLLVYCYVYCFVFFSFHRALSSVVALSASFICNKIPGLAPLQRTLCQTNPGAIIAVGEGSKLGLAECQFQFRDHRWNCSGVPSSLYPLLVTKEMAYLHAVRSAGVAYAITQACSQGNLTSCGCDKSKMEGRRGSAAFKWGGCSADIKYGMKFARIFMDAKEFPPEDSRTLVNLHNNRAGRKAVKEKMGIECKCHGPSGACTIKTCWVKLPPFREIGDRLSYKFSKAKKVIPVRGRRAQKPVFIKLERSKTLHKKPRRADLVYLNTSSSYCEADSFTGSLGTHGRTCNRSSNALNSCEFLCCGRGYNTHQYTKISQCECKFVWCCKVTCKRCSKRREVYTCK